MIKKLNEIFDETCLRLLSIDRLGERVQETLDDSETDEEILERLSAEVQRRLATAAKRKTRTTLQEIADCISRHKLMRAAQEDDDLPPWLNARHHRDRSGGACMCSVPNSLADRYTADKR